MMMKKNPEELANAPSPKKVGRDRPLPTRAGSWPPFDCLFVEAKTINRRRR